MDGNNWEKIFDMNRIILSVIVLLMSVAYDLRATENAVTSTVPDKNVEAHINLRPFDAIHSDVVAAIRFYQSDKSRIEAEGPERVISAINAEVRNEVLYITSKKNLRLNRGEKITLIIYSPTLSRIQLDGVGNVTCPQSVSTKCMEIINNGVGSVKLNDLHCEELIVKSEGVGGIELQGETLKATYRSDGVGSIEADEMLSEDAEVRLSGVGSVRCHASKSINACNDGVGSIRYSGHPEQEKVRNNGVGSVRSK